MVKLGFIKDASQAPPGFHRVFVQLDDGSAVSGEPATMVRSWPAKDGSQFFELAVNVPKGAENVHLWAPHMARILGNMGWNHWWLDSFSLSMVLDRYITEALRIWGLDFWGHYPLEGIALVQVGLQREAVSQSLAAWAEKHPDVRFSSAHDYEAIEREQEQQVKTRGEKFKAMLTPKIFTSKRTT